jgi:hypothetical protein
MTAPEPRVAGDEVVQSAENDAPVCRCVRYGAHFYYGVSCPVHGRTHPENTRVIPPARADR